MQTLSMTGKKLIIFDLDGTLIDSAPDLAAAVNGMYAKLNLPPMPINIIKSWVGNGSLKLVERAMQAHHIHDNAMIHHAHELFLAEYAHNTIEHTQSYAGVIKGLERLKAAGFYLAICTNKPERYLPKILSHFGWLTLFDQVIGGDTLSVKKPDPTPLLYLCQSLGIAPTDAIMVGDSKNDILAGQAAGMTTLALRYGYNYGEKIDLANPDAAFDDFDTLVDCILQKVYSITSYDTALF